MGLQNVVKMPTGRARRVKVASMDPDGMGPDYDVVAELTENKHDYMGDEWITLYAFPEYLRTCVDRVRERVQSTDKPGLSTAVCCCIEYGLEEIMGDEDVVALLELKSELNLIEDVDAEDLEEVASWFRRFPVSIPDAIMAGSKRQTVTITSKLKYSLATCANDLGVSTSALAVFALMYTLSMQPALLEGHRKELSRGVSRFVARVRRRKTVARALLSTL